MSKKTYELIVLITGTLSALAVGLITHFNVPYAAAINDSIQIAETAIVAICGNFAINEAKKLEKK